MKRAVVTHDVPGNSYVVRIFGPGPGELLVRRPARDRRGVQFLLRANRVDAARVVEVVYDPAATSVDTMVATA